MPFPATLYTHDAQKRDLNLTLTEWNALGDEVAALEATLGRSLAAGYPSLALQLNTITQQLTAGFFETTRVNLTVKNGATAASQVDIAADVLAIEGVVIPTFAKTVNIAVSGINGLDYAAEANSTWYYVWAGYNPTTATQGALLSTQSARANIVEPPGYTQWRRVGAVRNDSAGNFLAFTQQDTFVSYGTVEPATQIDQCVLLSSTPSMNNVYADVTCTGAVPPTTVLALVNASIRTGQSGDNHLKLRSSVGGSGGYVGTYVVGIAVTSFNTQWVYLAPATSKFQYTMTQASGTPTVRIDVLGYQDAV